MDDSRKFSLERQLISIMGQNREDSYATQRKRGYVLAAAARILHEKFGLEKLSNLGEKHVAHVIETWKVQHAGSRAIEEKLSHLRWLVRKIGKAPLIPRSNEELGIQPAARKTRAGKVISEDQFKAILTGIADERLKMAVQLARHLGLRFKEAMLFRPWKDWDGERVWLKRGTKGGRPRYLFLHNAKQREVLERARALVKGEAALIPGEVPTFEQWRQHCYRLLRKAGMGRGKDVLFHDLRRTYAADRMNDLKRKGRSPEEAARLVARELGHGRTEVLGWYLSEEQMNEAA